MLVVAECLLLSLWAPLGIPLGYESGLQVPGGGALQPHSDHGDRGPQSRFVHLCLLEASSLVLHLPFCHFSCLLLVLLTFFPPD